MDASYLTAISFLVRLSLFPFVVLVLLIIFSVTNFLGAFFLHFGLLSTNEPLGI